MRPISDSVSKLTNRTFTKKFISLGKILNHWNDIVGPTFSSKTQPLKIHYRRPKKKTEKPSATLDIAASSSDSTSLHYQKNLILERINQIFGDQWITDIRFVHVPANHDLSLNTKKRIRHLPLNTDEKKYLTETLEKIEDNELRSRLEKLGTALIQKKNKEIDKRETRP